MLLADLNENDYEEVLNYFEFCSHECVCDTDMKDVQLLDNFLANQGFEIYLYDELEDMGCLIPIWEYHFDNGDYIAISLYRRGDEWLVNYSSYDYIQSGMQGFETSMSFMHTRDVIDFIEKG